MNKKSTEKSNPAVEVAKELDNDETLIVELPYGVRAEIRPVSATLINEVTNHIEYPQVPIWHDEDKGRDEPNPNDPQYLQDVDEVNQKRGIAAMDAMVMFGVFLIDGLPEDESWVSQLKFMEKRKQIDLSGYDLDDSLEKEFLFKRFIGVSTNIFDLVTKASGISPEEVEAREDLFPGNEER